MASFEHPYSYGDKVEFDLPTSQKLDFIKGKWVFHTLTTQHYTGIVENVHRYQLTVKTQEGTIRVHPDMCQFANIAARILQKS